VNMGRFFIDRPIFAAVLSIIILIVGTLAFTRLPIASYPEIAPPTIVVTASYPGATAKTIAETVAAPIEQEVNGVEGMVYLYSQSTADGRMTLTISFKPGTDLNTAQVLVQNRVNIALPRLPEDVRRFGVITTKASPDILMVIHMLSPETAKPRRDQVYITNYALLQVRDQIARIDGVGSINLFGAREYAMRVWLDPDRIAAVGMTADEVIAALRAQNVQVAGGALGAPPVAQGNAFQLNLTLLGRLTDPAQFGDVIVRSSVAGAITRLKDVARIELGASDYSTNSYLDGQPAVAMVLAQRPGANALATSDAILAKMKMLSASFPPGLEYRVVYNPTEFIRESSKEVLTTIFEAILLVVLVVILFLQSWRAAIIPILAIPVSLVGTFAIMSMLGFSLNNLTLFGLVLAIGIVVDDAIVVVENVERNLASGMAPKEAAKRTMAEVSSALLSIALVLCAVFLPTAFIGGISGAFYQQFAVTIAAATIISCFNSFTLSPALAALLLKPHAPAAHKQRLADRFFAGFNRGFDSFAARYSQLVGRMTARPLLWAGVYVMLIALTGFMFTRVPSGFIPEQDKGYVIVAYQLPPGASLERTNAVIKRAEAIMKSVDGVTFAVSFAGFSGATRTNASNAGATFVGLTPLSERSRAAPAIIQELQMKLGAIQDAFIIVLNPPPVDGIGTAGGVQLMVQDRQGLGVQALNGAVWSMVGAASQKPGLVGVFSPYNAQTPQLYVDVDRTRAEILGVPVQNIFNTLQIYLGSAYVNDFTLFSRTYRVTAQADAKFRLSQADIANLRTRASDGSMVPLGSVVTFRSEIGPDRFARYNLHPAAELNASALPGTSTGQLIKTIESLRDTVLPPGITAEWTGLAYQQTSSGNTALFIFPLCVLFVFLVLAANYESWSLPLVIILIVPMCLLAAITGVWLRGFDNNILVQIGFIVLVGLAAKNAILIVEFARELEAQGKDAVSAAIEAARLRLRPILMTSLAFILGVVPLVIASGPGFEMRQSLGTAVFFGMIGVTLFGLLFTPIFYVLIRKLSQKRHTDMPLAGVTE
jgi:hydrophobe/amphiphile efflux-1 (HAE1) family protein